jgi:hypothetical protein
MEDHKSLGKQEIFTPRKCVEFCLVSAVAGVLLFLLGCTDATKVTPKEARRAIENGDTNTLGIYFRQGGDPGFKYPARGMRDPGPHLINLAAEAGRLSVLEMVIERGAGLDATDDRGRTALMYILNADKSTEHLTCFSTLIKHGANVNARDRYGESAIFLAVCYGLYEYCKMLVEARCDVNITNTNSFRPLHEVKDERIARLLIEAGADVNVTNINGQTPLDLAIKRKLPGVNSVIESARARGQHIP